MSSTTCNAPNIRLYVEPEVTSEVQSQTPEAFEFSEITDWKRHRNLVRNNISNSASGFRGCFGLAMAVNAGPADLVSLDSARPLVSDKVVRWFTLVDVPGGILQQGKRGESWPAHWATVRPTSHRYAAPNLAPGTETKVWDLRHDPSSPRPTALTIQVEKNPREFRVFNHLEMGMTSFAISRRDAWRNGRAQHDLHTLAGFSECDGKELYVIGDNKLDHLPKPETWMPKAYLGYPIELRPSLFTRCIRPIGGSSVYYADEFKAKFLDDLLNNELAYKAPFNGRIESIVRTRVGNMGAYAVTLRRDNSDQRETVHFSCKYRLKDQQHFLSGDVIATDPLDLPEGNGFWANWGVAVRLLGDCFNDFMSVWFDRQLVEVQPGLIHAPMSLTSLAAFGSAKDSVCYWEVGNATRYYQDDCDAFVFPVIPIKRWDSLAGSLPGAIAYDLMPTYAGYTPQPRRQRGPVRTPDCV